MASGRSLGGRFTPTCVGKPDSAVSISASHSGSPPRAWGSHYPRSCIGATPRFTPTCVGKPLHHDWNRDHRHGSPPRAWGSRRRSGRGPTVRRFTPTCVGKPRARYGLSGRFDGSPPRAWGSRRRSVRPSRPARFTPTCVGKPAPRSVETPSIAVHPHVRGEAQLAPHGPASQRGSPPRAWGSRRRPGRSGPSHRFTPTCVGKPKSRPRPSANPTVHPHVRGEADGRLLITASAIGSPPRAWGSRAGRPGSRHSSRFTPTCVGKPRSNWERSRKCTVHPHVRGEAQPGASTASSVGGSPPRAWGSRKLGRVARVEDAGSPPRAWGSRRPNPVTSPSNAVHPHVRGEAGARDRDRAEPCRFTPTCVGKPKPSLTSNPEKAVHPHVRGEAKQRSEGLWNKVGSPPRAWGSL